MAFAIMDAFPEKTHSGEAKRRSLLWRVMFSLPPVFNDSRAKAYLKTEAGQTLVSKPLLEAVGMTPMQTGAEVPVDEIFNNAARIAQRIISS